MRARPIIASFAIVAVLVAAGVIVWKFAFSGGVSLPLPLRSEYCTAKTSGEVTLTLDQMANAATIGAVGIRRGVPERAVTVALATALQESKLTNLDGGDRDSLGLFQQRPSQGWGTPTQIADPRYAAGRFYSALLRVHNWQRLSITAAAQAVQRSAVPSGYAKWTSDATILASALMGDKSAAVACNVSTTPTTRGPRALSDLTNILKQDWGTAAVYSETADSLALDVPGAQAGWQYAHWLVAHASDSGVERVQFGNLAWTAAKGVWRSIPRSQAPTLSSVAASTVIAQVYAAQK
ncbi:MAG TPA: hypothetical protein VIR00_08285 [Micromonosporaceae bacterium]|jgi:hypothetical protein